MSKTKRTTVDIPPHLKKRIIKVGQANGKSVTVATQVILEHALPDFESGRCKIQTAAVPVK